MRRGILLLVLLLAGCRYTFWPPLPEEAEGPGLVAVEAELVPEEGRVLAEIRVHRVPQPGYLLLRWYRDRSLLLETARFVEAPGRFQVPLPKAGEGSYRLELWWGEERVYLALLGSPSPPRKAPPEWKGN